MYAHVRTQIGRVSVSQAETQTVVTVATSREYTPLDEDRYTKEIHYEKVSL